MLSTILLKDLNTPNPHILYLKKKIEIVFQSWYQYFYNIVSISKECHFLLNMLKIIVFSPLVPHSINMLLKIYMLM